MEEIYIDATVFSQEQTTKKEECAVRRGKGIGVFSRCW
jgi:hypothetical protein